jgi:two-component sensor histidine kinase
LIEEELAPFGHEDTRRFSISGPDIMLAPAIAQSLALTLHELTTNAAKYGALSTDGGSLDLSWLINGDGVLSIDWRESGGPPTSSPQKKGFGTRILFAGVEQQLNGKAEMEWLEDGLRCKLFIPNANASDGAQAMSGVDSNLVAPG